MGTRDRRVDAYIAKSAPFARPVLAHLREAVHAACPGVEETMKWGHPHFMYHGMLCGMGAFQQHCTFGFWKGELIVDPKDRPAEQGMGQFGRITALADLPAKQVLRGYVRAAMKLNEQGVPKPAMVRARRKAASSARRPVVLPAELGAALARQRRARTAFEGFSPSQRREYAEWIAEAKRAETRAARVRQAIAWIAEGKPRNWKYLKRWR